MGNALCQMGNAVFCYVAPKSRVMRIKLEKVNLTDTLFCDKCVFCVNVFHLIAGLSAIVIYTDIPNVHS